MTDEERAAFAERAWEKIAEGLAKARAERATQREDGERPGEGSDGT